MPATSKHTITRTQWVTAAQVRATSGYNSTRDIPDPDLNQVILDAQAELVKDIAVWVQGLELDGNVNGTNTVFELPGNYRLIFDDNFDDAFTAADVFVYTMDTSTDPPTPATVAVTSLDSRHGRITLTVAPSGSKTVHLDTYLLRRVIDVGQAKLALKLLASHYADIRVIQSQGVTLANPAGGKTFAHGQKRDWLAQYHRVLQGIRGSLTRGVLVDTRLEREGREVVT